MRERVGVARIEPHGRVELARGLPSAIQHQQTETVLQPRAGDVWRQRRTLPEEPFCQLGRFHNIEVEDNITTYLEWADGATGVFVSSTGESPGTNRFELCGTRGKLVLENNKISFTRNDADMIEFSRTSKSGFAKPDVWNVDIPFDSVPNPHAILMQNFVDAIIDGSQLSVPGAEGIHSVELAHVMLYSSVLNETVDLPMNSAAYE